MDVNDRRARATDEAGQWWMRLGTQAPNEVSEAERQEFTQWLRESPLHVAELLQVAHVHDALERFKLWEEIPLDTSDPDDNIRTLPSPRERPRKARRARGVLLAACIALIAVASAWLTVRPGTTVIATDRAERREIVLADGSAVTLDPQTQLRVSLGKQRRSVALIQGRALFHVAKDPARPFIVQAGATDVRAVGTTFGVEQRNQSIIVTVSQGRVAIAEKGGWPARVDGETHRPRSSEVAGPLAEPAQDGPSTQARSSPGEVFLSADQQITVHPSGAASPIQKVDANTALAWSEGQLVFDSTPLREVAAEFNRYNRAQLRILGDELNQRTISGVFRATDPETLIDFISAGAHVTVTRKGNEEIVISPSR